MSAEFSSRRPTEPEQRLLDFLMAHARAPIVPSWRELLRVRTMNDGGMGSLLLFPTGREPLRHRRFGGWISDCEFKDTDDVVVIASVNVDKEGELFELDLWKVDSSPLHRIADTFSTFVFERPR